MSQRLLLQFRLVPFSTSPHTAKGRLRHLCAFLVPSLWLINYVLPQRGRREAQRFLELGLRPKPQTHCRRQTKTSLRPPCAPFAANQLCFATKEAQRGTKVFRVGAPSQTTQTHCRRQPKTSLRPPCAPFAAKNETVNENPATESSLGSLPQH